MRFLACLLLALTSVLLPPAQTALAQVFSADPPARVARLAEHAGMVELAHGHSDWQRIGRHHPVTAGDNILVGPDGRAEFDLGSIRFWLAGGSALYVEALDDRRLALRLSEGALAIRVHRWRGEDSIRLSLDGQTISLLAPGFYLLEAGHRAQGSGNLLAVRSGMAEIDGDFNRLQRLRSGDAVEWFAGGEPRLARWSGVGSFEAWAQSRDRRFQRQRQSAWLREPYDEDLIGIYELDEHGRWDTHWEYGRVWYPSRVGPDWAPYRFGRWSYVRPWGWTWIDDAPWGFAPFHYGRWVRIGGRWAWCPGRYTSRPVYAPALVAFFGGSNWNISITSGPALAWVPLGWNEPYTPWYSYSPNYWRHLNRPYVRNRAEDPWRPPAYIHSAQRDAVSLIPTGHFVSGRPVSEALIRTPGVDLRSAPPAPVYEFAPQWHKPNAGGLPKPGDQPWTASMPTPQRPIIREQTGASSVQEWAPVRPTIEPRVLNDPNPVVGRVVTERSVRERSDNREPLANPPAPSTPPTLRPPVMRDPNPLAPTGQERVQRMPEAMPEPARMSAPPATVREIAPNVSRGEVVRPPAEPERRDKVLRKPAGPGESVSEQR